MLCNRCACAFPHAAVFVYVRLACMPNQSTHAVSVLCVRIECLRVYKCTLFLPGIDSQEVTGIHNPRSSHIQTHPWRHRNAFLLCQIHQKNTSKIRYKTPVRSLTPKKTETENSRKNKIHRICKEHIEEKSKRYKSSSSQPSLFIQASGKPQLPS